MKEVSELLCTGQNSPEGCALFFFFFFKIFLFIFLMWTKFKVFIKLLQYCFCFSVLVFFFWPQGMRVLSSPTRHQTRSTLH